LKYLLDAVNATNLTLIVQKEKFDKFSAFLERWLLRNEALANKYDGHCANVTNLSLAC